MRFALFAAAVLTQVPAAFAQELQRFPETAPLPSAIETAILGELDPSDIFHGASRWEGNLAGDQTPDQLVQAAFSPNGGNGVFVLTWIFVGKGSGFSAMVPVDISNAISSAARDGNDLVVTMTTLLPDDPRCCPTGIEVMRVPLN